MTDIVERIKTRIHDSPMPIEHLLDDCAEEIKRLRAFIGWVDDWTSYEVGSYSIYALDGIFKMTVRRSPHFLSLKGI